MVVQGSWDVGGDWGLECVGGLWGGGSVSGGESLGHVGA